MMSMLKGLEISRSPHSGPNVLPAHTGALLESCVDACFAQSVQDVFSWDGDISDRQQSIRHGCAVVLVSSIGKGLTCRTPNRNQAFREARMFAPVYGSDRRHSV